MGNRRLGVGRARTYQKALEKARAEMAKAKGESLEPLQLKIEQLDAALHTAWEMKEKATSKAQLTRSGHVYVISNVGSFGSASEPTTRPLVHRALCSFSPTSVAAVRSSGRALAPARSPSRRP